MTRLSVRSVVGLLLALGCGGSDSGTGVPAGTYTLTPAAATIALGQDSSTNIVMVVKRTEPDTATIVGARLTYSSDDYTIATVDGAGLVTALKGGTTAINVKLGSTVASIPVTVNPRPATLVQLTILTGPAGGAVKSVDADTGTYYALPADPTSTKLKGLVRVGNDTVFCNFCVTKTPARIRRTVRFRSLDTLKATITNPGSPLVQVAGVDDSGLITALDTTSTGVKFVLEVPSDGVADTVTVKFALRPIDSLFLRPDSNSFPAADGTGLTKMVYPNADFTQANVKASSTTNFIVGLDFISIARTIALPATPATPGANRLISSKLFGAPTVLRKSVPNVTWQSANTDYLDINAAGSVIGKCASVGGSATLACLATGSTVLTCASVAGTMPAAFAGIGNYTVPSCGPPAKTIPYPGALCTTASSTDLNTTCTIWVRATAKDQVDTTKVLTSRYRINIGR